MKTVFEFARKGRCFRNRNIILVAFILFLLAAIYDFGESRRLTVEDFERMGINEISQSFLEEYSKVITVKGKSEEPVQVHVDGIGGGGMHIDHEHYQLVNYFRREGRYSKISNRVKIKSNETNLIHPLGIKIGTDFNTIMRKIKVKANVFDVYSVKIGETKYIEGDKDADKYISLTRDLFFYYVTCKFDMDKTDDKIIDGSIEFCFDIFNMLKDISYIYTITDLTPRKDFIYEEYLEDLRIPLIRPYDLDKRVRELFPNEEYAWERFEGSDGRIGGMVTHGEHFSVIYEDRYMGRKARFAALRIQSNKYREYLPVDIEIGDGFETVMTKFNAPERDLLKILGVNDIAEWDSGRKVLYERSTETIYLSKEDIINWEENAVKDYCFSLIYKVEGAGEDEYLKFNFDSNMKLLSMESVQFDRYYE